MSLPASTKKISEIKGKEMFKLFCTTEAFKLPMARATTSEVQRFGWCSQHQSSHRTHHTPPAPETLEVRTWTKLCYAPHFPMMLDYLSGEEKINLHLENQHPWVAHRVNRSIKHSFRTQHLIHFGLLKLKSWWKLKHSTFLKENSVLNNSCCHGPR